MELTIVKSAKNDIVAQMERGKIEYSAAAYNQLGLLTFSGKVLGPREFEVPKPDEISEVNGKIVVDPLNGILSIDASTYEMKLEFKRGSLRPGPPYDKRELDNLKDDNPWKTVEDGFQKDLPFRGEEGNSPCVPLQVSLLKGSDRFVFLQIFPHEAFP